MNEPLNVWDYERLAAERVPPETWCYFAGGADDEVTLRANLLAYRRLRLRPRMLVDVETVSTETTVLGTRVSMPLLVAPLAYQGLLDPEGEAATARAAEAAGTIMCVSTVRPSTPVSSSTSRSAVCSALSPGAISPFGSAQTPSALPCGRIAASIGRPRCRRTSTPPAENSRRTDDL